MNTPPFLLFATVLFWGMETRHLWIAIPISILLEAPRYLSWRWDLKPRDFDRILDFCGVVLVLGALFRYGNERQDSIQFIQWIPLIFLPFLVAQKYAVKNYSDPSTFFWFFRGRQRIQNRPVTAYSFDYPFLALCLLGASSVNQRDIRFYLGIVILIGWGLFNLVRPTLSRSGILLWMGIYLPLTWIGFQGQIGLHSLQGVLENKVTEWFSNVHTSNMDREMSRTSMGSIGRLKLSNEIIMRIKKLGSGPVPEYLHTECYDEYRTAGRSGTWFHTRNDFMPLAFENDFTVWRIHPTPTPSSAIQISMFFKYGKGWLSLPEGTFLLKQIPTISLEKNSYGAFRADGITPFVQFTTDYSSAISNESPPQPADLMVPAPEKDTLEKIRREIGIHSGSSPENLEKIQRFFQTHFQYSLEFQKGTSSFWKESTPLSIFLLNSRAGHCEYFATATVLLLRHIGIPARYATGYAVQEYSSLTQTYLIRQRHAHAWTRVFIDGHWVDFDTTSSNWNSLENKRQSILQTPSDLFSWIWFKFSELRWLKTNEKFRPFMIYTSILLFGILVVRFLYRLRKEGKFAERTQRPAFKTLPSQDSEFYLIEKKLQEQGFSRNPGETVWNWLRRIEKDYPDPNRFAKLKALSSLHYRYRFDPLGVSKGERNELKTETLKWMEKAPNKA